MTPRCTSLSWSRPLFRTVSSLLLILFVASPQVELRATEMVRKNYNIRATTAEESLKVFAEQSGLEVVFASKTVGKVRTNSVRGLLTPTEALDLLLADTGLNAHHDSTSGAVTVSTSPNGLRVAHPESDRPLNQKPEVAVKNVSSQPGAVLRLDEYPVTGTRIRSLVAEQSVQPVMTITRQEIDRYGISNLGDVFRYIPQVTSYTTGQLVQTPTRFASENATISSGRITATLRGSPAGGTLLLINGRRAPKTGQETGQDAYDLSGIPLSAVERIDVLLDGASAVYGADAVGGVINVILKRHYRGTEIRVSYENTFDSDTGVLTGSIAHGFAAGRVSGLIDVSYETANTMMWADRWFLQSMDRRPLGGNDLRDPQVPGGSGWLEAVTGNLPGLGVNRVGIPEGSTGVNITTQQYASAPVPGPLDAATSVAYSTPYERWHAGASIDYEWTTDHQVLASVRYGSTTLMSHNTVPYIPFRIALPAGAPGNPFGTTVLLTKAFWDIPIPQRDLESTSLAANLGVRGRWRADWRYEATLNFARSEAELLAEPLNLNVTRLNQALASGQPPVLAYDSTRVRNANAPGVIEGFADPAVLSEEVTDVWTYDIQVDGSVVELPSGAVRLAAGSEYREEYVDFPAQASNSPNPRGRNRYTAGVFAELFVPIVSERRSWPLLRGLDLRAAVRHDRYSDFAQSTTPNFGVLYRPFGKLLLRASYGEGYKLPTLSQLYAPVSSTLVSFPIGNPGFLDPLRDYTPVLLPPPAGRMPVTRGGNATLQPERSTNMTAGAVFDVPFVKGLSGSVGYFDTEYVDRAGAIPLTDRIALFPDTVVRGPRGPSEPAHWAGPVIGYEDKAMNIAYERLTGWDATVKYSVVTAVGEITAQSTASRITRRDVRTAPHLPPTTASTGDTYPLQSAGSLFLTRGKYDVGLMYAYRAKFRPSNLPTSRYTPSALRWDCQFSYSFAELSTDGPRATWWRRALDDVKVSVTIFNVLNDMPPLGPSTLPDNSVVDSRMRRYAVNLVKRF